MLFAFVVRFVFIKVLLVSTVVVKLNLVVIFVAFIVVMFRGLHFKATLSQQFSKLIVVIKVSTKLTVF